MGIVPSGAEFLVAAAHGGVRFERTLTIARLSNFLDRETLSSLDLSPAEIEAVLADRYADGLLGVLGANQVDALDVSDYEGATIVHDLNLPAPESLRARFSAVIEVGSLEHVFNFVEALRTCLDAVEPDGHFLAITPTNNEAGHGFYQFSPELWFRVLDSSNGYVVERMLIRELDRPSPWYEVNDPATVGARAEFLSSGPTYLFIQARRVVVRPILETFPQQSDYVARWDDSYGGELAPWRTPPERAIEALKKSHVVAVMKSRVLRSRFNRVEPGARGYRKMVRWDYRRHAGHFVPISELVGDRADSSAASNTGT